MTESAQRAAASSELSSFGERVEQIRERSEQARAGLRDVRGSATSADGSVTVEVESSGALRDLRLSAAALDLGADALARLVLATAIDARRAMLRRAEASVTAVVGPQSRALGVLQAQLDALGATDSADPAQPAHPAGPADATADPAGPDDGAFAGRGR